MTHGTDKALSVVLVVLAIAQVTANAAIVLDVSPDAGLAGVAIATVFTAAAIALFHARH